MKHNTEDQSRQWPGWVPDNWPAVSPPPLIVNHPTHARSRRVPQSPDHTHPDRNAGLLRIWSAIQTMARNARGSPDDNAQTMAELYLRKADADPHLPAYDPALQHRIIKNAWIDYHKTRWRRKDRFSFWALDAPIDPQKPDGSTFLDALTDDSQDPARIVLLAVTQRRIRHAVMRLSQDQQTVTLARMLGEEPTQTAARIQRPAGTIRRVQYNARRKLARELADLAPPEAGRQAATIPEPAPDPCPQCIRATCRKCPHARRRPAQPSPSPEPSRQPEAARAQPEPSPARIPFPRSRRIPQSPDHREPSPRYRRIPIAPYPRATRTPKRTDHPSDFRRIRRL